MSADRACHVRAPRDRRARRSALPPFPSARRPCAPSAGEPLLRRGSWPFPLPSRQADIERSLAAMMLRGRLIGRDQVAEFRLREPERHGPLQRAVAAHRTALAGYDEHVAHAALMGADQKIEKDDMGFALHQAVQVDACFQRQAALGDLALDRPFQRLMHPGRPFRHRWRCRLFRCKRRRRLLFGLLPLHRRLRLGEEGIEFTQLTRLAGHRPGAAGHLAPEDSLIGAELAILGHQSNRPAAALGMRMAKSAALRTVPARSPARSPEPVKMSPRAGPTIAEPVSSASISRAKARPSSRWVRLSARMKKGKPKVWIKRSTASERPARSGTLAAAIGPAEGSATAASRKKI
ncbi:hypothetical protein RHECNPAF_3340025 [Rhizobium etli CNPAF512]|nr:hypothetical protein RHECNPAF_3340025 [Rhizobium etli CNPAF512]